MFSVYEKLHIFLKSEKERKKKTTGCKKSKRKTNENHQGRHKKNVWNLPKPEEGATNRRSEPPQNRFTGPTH